MVIFMRTKLKPVKHMKNICIISTDAGQGHRATERAIRQSLEDHQSLNIQSVEVYQDLLAPFDLGARTLGITAPDIYNRFVLQKGNSGVLWILLCIIARLWVGWNKQRMIRHLQKFWSESRPDIVISVVPLFNGILAESLDRYSREIPYITVISDFCEMTRGVWIQSSRQIVAAGTEKAQQQARDFGLPERQIIKLPGMVISPLFYKALGQRSPSKKNRPETALLIFGGHAPQRLLKYAKTLSEDHPALRLICVCGKNKRLAVELRRTLAPKHDVYGFISNLSGLYDRADVVIGKPGPGIISEALLFGKPLLLERNRVTLIQERFNARWVQKLKYGKLFSNQQTLSAAIEHINESTHWQELNQAVYAYRNDAVYQVRDAIVDLLEIPAVADGPRQNRRPILIASGA